MLIGATKIDEKIPMNPQNKPISQIQTENYITPSQQDYSKFNSQKLDISEKSSRLTFVLLFVAAIVFVLFAQFASQF